MSDERPDADPPAGPDPHRAPPADAAEPTLRVPTEAERAAKAAILGSALGAILAVLGRRR